MKCKDDVSHAECIMCLIVYATIVGMLLIVSDNEDHGQNPRKYASHFACIWWNSETNYLTNYWENNQCYAVEIKTI